MSVADVTIFGTRVRCYDDKSSVDRFVILYMNQPHRDTRVGKECQGLCSGNDPIGCSGHIACCPGAYLGRRVSFHDLPEPVRLMVRNDLNKDGE